MSRRRDPPIGSSVRIHAHVCQPALRADLRWDMLGSWRGPEDQSPPQDYRANGTLRTTLLLRMNEYSDEHRTALRCFPDRPNGAQGKADSAELPSHHRRPQVVRPQAGNPYAKAKRYCEAPYEVRQTGSRKIRVPIEGEQIGETRNGARRKVSIRCGSATEIEFTPDSLDGVFTDPPYFGNVQYGELMDFCYVWLRRLIGKEAEGFNRPFTRSPHELTGNVTEGRGLERFTEGLSKVYSRMVDALKPGAPLVFTYHHNRLEAYCAIGVAILDAGVVCSASLPCPAEMGGSIHIHGTTSSIIDTVFVCRKSGTTRRSWLFDTPDRLVEIVSQDLTDLAATGRRPSHGDTRCIVFGHLTRMAVWKLRETWKPSSSTKEKIVSFRAEMKSYGDPDQLARRATTGESMEDLPLIAQKTNKIGEGPPEFISF